MIDPGGRSRLAISTSGWERPSSSRRRGHKVPVVLRACQALPGSKRDGGGFRLEFAGPLNPQLGQGTFAFQIDHDQYGLFIVPIGESERSRRYEAVFY